MMSRNTTDCLGKRTCKIRPNKTKFLSKVMSGDESAAGFMVMAWIGSSHPSRKANDVHIKKRQGR